MERLINATGKSKAEIATLALCALPSGQLEDVIEAHLTVRRGLDAQRLEDLSNKIGQRAHDLARENFVQMVGRGYRTELDKPDPQILDMTA